MNGGCGIGKVGSKGREGGIGEGMEAGGRVGD